MIENFHFKKKFGQNFITDLNLLEAIVSDAGITEDDEVLEIGAGAGALTKVLAKACKKVVAFEIDETLKEHLELEFSKHKNITLVMGDILNFSAADIKSYFSGSFKIVANLPYYITTPIIFKFIEEDYNIADINIMVQKEVAERLIARPGTKDYGVITAKINAIANVKKLRDVSRHLFTPVPNVDSSIVQIKFADKNLGEYNKKTFQRVVNSAFAMRRKTLANNLSAEFSMPKEQIYKILEELGLNLQIRGESLSSQEFAKIATKITK